MSVREKHLQLALNCMSGGEAVFAFTYAYYYYYYSSIGMVCLASRQGVT